MNAAQAEGATSEDQSNSGAGLVRVATLVIPPLLDENLVRVGTEMANQ